MTHPRSFASNGVRRSRSDVVHRSDVANWRSNAPPVRTGNHSHVSSNSSSPPSSGRHHHQSSAGDEDEFHAAGNRGGAHDNPLHGRLLFLTTCLVGQLVDVQLRDGSVYSGIFHTANVDKDFGVVLKMAKVTKEATGKVAKNDPKQQARRPVKLLIIHAKDLVQIAAKEVLLTGESFSNGRSRDNKNELLTDSVISQTRRENKRELKPWKPDSDAPRHLALESTFQSPWNKWDQFQTNKDLYGVESTYNEEIYTTKLERGPQTREREREASRLAREIESKLSRNSALEERYGSDTEYDDLDEESRYSSVLRRSYDDGGDDGHSKNDELNDQTFGSVTVASDIAAASDASTPVLEPAGSPRSSASAGDIAAFVPTLGPASSELPRESKVLESARKGKKDQVNDLKHFAESSKERIVRVPDARLAKAPSTGADKLAESSEKAPADVPKHIQSSISPPPASAVPIPVGLSSTASTGSSGSSRSPAKLPASSPQDLSRSSSLDAPRDDAEAVASTSSGGGSGVKKSALNPNAKEFKLNPNAKAFTPTLTTQRPASPINQQSQMYVPAQLQVAQMPVGMGYMPSQPAQFAQYNSTITPGVTAASYIQPSQPAGGFVPPPQIKIPPQTQPQANTPHYGQQQMRYMPPVQPAAAYPPTFPMFPPHHIMYYPMMPPQSVMPPPQLSQQPQRGESHGHPNAAPSVLVGQSPVQSPLASPVPPGNSSGNAPPKPATNGGARGGKS